MEEKEERALIKSIKKGNISDFEKIVDSYERVLLHIAFYIVGNKEDAEDLCQEAFIKLFKYIKSFLPKKGSLKGYLYKTISNLCFNHLKKKKLNQKDFYDEEKSITTNSKEMEGEVYNIVNNLLKFLKPKERIVFSLREIDDMEYNEIAKMLKLNEITIRRYYSMARQKLKELIEKKYPEYRKFYEKNT